MKLINNICFYLNHTRDVTMYADLFTKFEDKKICFLFNNLFKEKKDNNLNEYSRIKKFLKKNYPKYNEIHKLSDIYKKNKYKVLISAGDIPTSKITPKSVVKFVIKKFLQKKDVEIYDRNFLEKKISLNSIRFPNNLDRNIKYFPEKEWGRVFDIFFICLKIEKSLIEKKFTNKKIYNIGFPRLDKKFNVGKIRKKLIKEFKLDPKKKIIFYLPTLSIQKNELVLKYIEELKKLSKHYNVIIRPHPKDQDLHKEKFNIFKKSNLKLDLKDGRDTADLILTSNLIISDGGSSVVEAVYLGKKVIIHNWQRSVNTNLLENRFKESFRLDKIFGGKLLNLDSLSDLKNINNVILGKDYKKKIIKLNKKFFFTKSKKMDVVKIISSIYDN